MKLGEDVEKLGEEIKLKLGEGMLDLSNKRTEELRAIVKKMYLLCSLIQEDKL